VRTPDGATAPALVPFVSLLNHSPWPHIVRFSEVDAASNALQLRLLRPAAAGEEVCLSYGPLPNQDLLLFYGFAVRGNPSEAAEVELPADRLGGGGDCGASGKLQAARATALGKLGLSRTASLRPGWRARQLPQLLPAARVLAADEAQLAAWAASCGRRGGGGGDTAEAWPSVAAADGGNEAAAAALLEAAVAAARAPYESALGRVREAALRHEEPGSGDSSGGGGGFTPAETAAFLGHLETWLGGVVDLLASEPQS
jgi:hypothetical protein